MTAALWDEVRPKLPKKQKKPDSSGRLLVLGGATVEKRQEDVLKLGPKFCIEPRLDIVDRLTLTRNVARYVPEKEKDRCVVECVDVAAKASARTGSKPDVGRTVKYLVEHNLRVVQADKEGMFVVLPDALYLEKASLAVAKCFTESKVSVEKVKKRAMELLKQCNQEKLASDVKNAKEMKLEVFFTAKTHKEDIPFRPIVSERGSWHVLVAAFLQKMLNTLTVVDPYELPNSEVLVEFLESGCGKTSCGMSIDVQDLYYSLPHEPLMQ